MIISAKQAYEHAYINGLTFPPNWYITKNFKWSEAFTNEKTSDGIPIFEVFQNIVLMATQLQKIRDNIGLPIIVHCWVRQVPHNKRAGSTAKYSPHINGRAVDFHIQGMSESAARQKILNMGLPIRIEANTVGWVHNDISNYVTPFKAGLFY